MTEIATRPRELDGFDTLDIYAGGVKESTPRVDALATISAGEKKKTVKHGKDVWYPVVSRDGSIKLHDPEGRAPKLAERLRRDPKNLTITFAFDNPRQFMQQRFVRYSASRLEVYGDQFSLTEIKLSGTQEKPIVNREVHDAGTESYRRLLETCKVAVSVYFLLAEWDGNGVPKAQFPDGLGFYRLRFTSRHSLDNLIAQLRLVHEFTGGRLAGVPFDLRLINREVSDPTGAKRTVPLWTITMRRPGEMALSSDNFRRILSSGLSAGDQLKLPVPTRETHEMVALEGDVDLDAIELSEDDIRQLESGINPAFRRKQWFAGVKGTFLDTDEAREAFLAEHTDGMTSLNDAVKYLDQPEWDGLLAAATKAVMDREHERLETQHEATNTDPDSYRDDITEKHLDFLNKQLKRATVPDVQRFEFISWLLGEEVRSNRDLTPAHMTAFMARMGTVNEGKFQPLPDSRLADLMGEYGDFYSSDANAQSVLD